MLFTQYITKTFGFMQVDFINPAYIIVNSIQVNFIHLDFVKEFHLHTFLYPHQSYLSYFNSKLQKFHFHLKRKFNLIWKRRKKFSHLFVKFFLKLRLDKNQVETRAQIQTLSRKIFTTPPSLATAIVIKTGFSVFTNVTNIEKFQDIFIFFRPSLYSQWWQYVLSTRTSFGIQSRQHKAAKHIASRSSGALWVNLTAAARTAVCRLRRLRAAGRRCSFSCFVRVRPSRLGSSSFSSWSRSRRHRRWPQLL